MSFSIVGDNANPTVFYTLHKIYNEDRELVPIEGELLHEEVILARRAVVPKNSNTTTVTIFFYYFAPTSEWYWKHVHGIPFMPVTPVVFAADTDWKLTQCLNTSFDEISLTGQSNGWKSFDVTLTRKLVKGERIVFGLYSDLLGYSSTGETEDSQTTMSYYYWSNAPRPYNESQITYITSPEFISQQRNMCNGYEISLYLQYENESYGRLYTCTVLGTVSNSESLTRLGENKRSFDDKADVVARPFAARLFYRTVETVMSFLDWIRGKIRAVNYFVTLYTPVVTEITLGNENMKRMYKGKSKLRIVLDCGCDLSGYASVHLVCRKPDDTVVRFPSVVKDTAKGIIFYDVQSKDDFDQSGWWTLWPEFVFDDARTSCGRAIRQFVYEVGT